jgi:hypothetical protein
MIADARKWLKSRAETIPGIKAHAEPGQSFTPPCIVFDWSSGAPPAADYRQPGASARWGLKAYLLITTGDAHGGYASLDKYIETYGEYSVKAALEGDRTNTNFDVSVISCDEAGAVVYAGGKYYGASFSVEVYSPE